MPSNVLLKFVFIVCGIIGIKKFKSLPDHLSLSKVQKGLLKQQHRGPDFHQAVIHGSCVLGHNRLAIIDLNERSNQPFFDDTLRYSIVFNGEIYNFPELKNELLKKGVFFKTSSDTEVLLHFMIQFGETRISELDGCFAFAFYDKLEDKLILARDHMGINPLLFSINDEEIQFASDLRAFFDLNTALTVDDYAVNCYFKFTYIPAPKTILKEVSKLLPGHYIKIEKSHIDYIQYWSPRVEKNDQISTTEAITEGKQILKNAVLKRMDADVPLGAFLSGGIDSSIVSAIAAEHRDGFQTFSIGFGENEYFDESKYAKEVAEHIKSIHHPINLSREKVSSKLSKVLDAFDEPFADSSAIAMYFLSSAAKKNLTVCLSGDGADELLGGYNKHRAFLRAQKGNVVFRVIGSLALKYKGKSRAGKWQNKMRQLAKFGELMHKKWPENYWFLAAFINDENRKKLLKKYQNIEFDSLNSNEESLNEFLLMDQQFVLPNDMLKKVDLMSMQHSLEVRTPFLDKAFVHFVNGLPSSLKNDGNLGKILLREAFGDDLPNTVFSRAKKGFEVPLSDWIKSAWNDITDEKWFSEDFISDQSIFNIKFVFDLKSKFFSKQPEESAILVWSYIVFQAWYEKWMVKK